MPIRPAPVAFHGNVRRWDVFWANLEPHIGSEQGGNRRPVLVVSNDGFNAHMPVVTVLPLTKLEGKTRKPYPFEVMLPRGVVGRDHTSIVMPYQVRTISRQRLLEPLAHIRNPAQRREIEDRLLMHLGIELEREP